MTDVPDTPIPGLRLCFERMKTAEQAVHDTNELSRQYALTMGDDGTPTTDSDEMFVQASVTASTAIHHARSSLDNLVAELVGLNLGVRLRANAFPVTADNSEGRREFNRRLRGVAEPHVAAIASCQPSHYPTDSPLARLYELSGRDKHERLLLIKLSDTQVVNFQWVEVPGWSFVWADDGRDVVHTLRECVAAVNVVLRAFSSAFENRDVVSPIELEFKPPGVALEAQRIAGDDPINQSRQDVRLVMEVFAGGDLERIDVPNLMLVRDALKRLRNSPEPMGVEPWRESATAIVDLRLRSLGFLD